MSIGATALRDTTRSEPKWRTPLPLLAISAHAFGFAPQRISAAMTVVSLAASARAVEPSSSFGPQPVWNLNAVHRVAGNTTAPRSSFKKSSRNRAAE